MSVYITKTNSFLPGSPVSNQDIELFLGRLDGEESVKEQILAMNGIRTRHYAQDLSQQSTHDVYDLAVEAVRNLELGSSSACPISLLTAGTTYAPMSGPGIGSIIHHRLAQAGLVNHPLEISSHSGICTSSSAAFIQAVRAVQSKEHLAALAIGTEHSSEVLKATAIRPMDDRSQHNQLRNSRWFMSVFLRFMLSDGAGVFLLEGQPRPNRKRTEGV